MRFQRFAAAAVGVAALVTMTACSSTGGRPRESGGDMGGGQADTPRFTVAMVTHGPPGDTFWDLIRKGAETAAKKDNIDLKYSAELQGPDQANLVQNAIDSKVDALAVTLAKPEALGPAIDTAVKAGIPVVAFNAGIDNWKAAGAKAYFGQDEKISGEAAGKRLAVDGAKKVICVIQDQGNVALESRCAGVKAGFDGQVENLNVNGTDMPSVQSTITAKLQQDPSIDYIMTLGAPIALAATDAAAGAGSTARIATFDTNAALVDAIKGDKVQWAVDQQPFLQGYLAVDSLWLFLNNGNVIGGGQPTLTGPAFIDKSNIDAIAEYAKNGTR
ncbi:monosaccharide ABC transporter substrate-binding protein (CUT2 family) [Mycobacterium sp. BK558]|uniref:TMAO reductase system periplasmic protein TorT n=1 Tax=Mycolicibacterium chlorophenolicum TaxID=37916 RepID=A0A0J6VJR3_9MYCO|nr:substrate-binding domain-containing protein [Mycolicibacterium chlorophenolicum]KMO71235.1 TMAO reductase system periplasmic protein TorT [Mycolicibacterium chlorophenolicum]RZT07655.1 monosaccharide ABC transporter substrate-binding protein (CUT2 family) [Mycobacterium sp. BK558]